MGKIEVLRVSEGARIEGERVVALYAEYGVPEAERLIGAAMEEMAVHLSKVAEAYEHDATGDLVAASEDLAALALRFGMSALAGIAEDVAFCAEEGDAVGLAATVCRLVRLGDRSLTAIWDGPVEGS